MKIYEKIKDNNIRTIYFLGMKVFQYKKITKKNELDSSIFEEDIKKYYGIYQSRHNIKNIVLGSSHARDGYIPKDNEFNLGNSSQDLYRVFKLYEWVTKNQFEKLENIIVFYDVFSSGFQLDKTSESYKCIPYKYLYHIPYICPIEDNFNISKIIWKSQHNVPLDYRGISNWDKKRKDKDTAEVAERHIKHTKRENNQTAFIENLFLLAKKNYHKIYIIIPPLRHDFRLYLPKHEIIYKDLFDVCVQYPDITLLNYQNDDDFLDDYFNDCDHLNQKGATLLTQKIQQHLK